MTTLQHRLPCKTHARTRTVDGGEQEDGRPAPVSFAAFDNTALHQHQIPELIYHVLTGSLFGHVGTETPSETVPPRLFTRPHSELQSRSRRLLARGRPYTLREKPPKPTKQTNPAAGGPVRPLGGPVRPRRLLVGFADDVEIRVSRDGVGQSVTSDARTSFKQGSDSWLNQLSTDGSNPSAAFMPFIPQSAH